MHAGTIARQVEEAFTTPYNDPDTGEDNFIHETYIFTSKTITQEAKDLVREQVGNKKGLVHFFDRNQVLEIIRTIR